MEDEPITNADRIRKMSDEELAQFIRAVRCCYAWPNDDCDFPFCESMNGNLCHGIMNHRDEALINWLKEV